MRIEIVRYPQDEDWLLVRNDALFTQRKHSDVVPEYILRQKYLASEHSPIRDLNITANFFDVKSWIVGHFSRHHDGFLPYYQGFEPFISTQRNDIQHVYDRDSARQDTLVDMRFSANAQAIINISRKRICRKAHVETTKLWLEFLVELEKVFPEIIPFCVPECIYRGGICSEVFGTCGYNKSKNFLQKLEQYKEKFM